MTLVFFHARADYLKRILPEGGRRLISGRVEEFNGALQITHPDYMVPIEEADEIPEIEPIYPLTAGLSAKVMAKAARGAAAMAPELPDWLDRHFREQKKWAGWQESIRLAHHPTSLKAVELGHPARARLAYDELLANQLALALVREKARAITARPLSGDGGIRKKLETALPYTLTNAQKMALAEIEADIARPQHMARLLQGDVGSGKTVVALMVMAAAAEVGAQAVMMAPTEVLARQHLESLAPFCEAADLRAELLTGRDKGAVRIEKLERLRAGEIDLLFGTHALFSEDVEFKDLGLVVVDEQHRFGVRQRLALAHKGARPHLLVMTATPIPRTLELTAYGDMDVSRLTEKPAGRKPIDTRALPLERLGDVVAAVERAMAKGGQIYWVCPLVEESEMADLTSAEDRAAGLREVFGTRVGLVHGRMKGEEKDAALIAFRSHETPLLVATTVIEVGVDAPGATVIVIEHAERFGLAQLHQLRGRVGRGDQPGSCLLLYRGPLGETAKARLSILRDTNDGFLIAEEDLRLRGAGDLLGEQQSGMPKFKVADVAAHAELLAAARDDAKLILTTDPELQTPRGEALRTLLYLFERDDAVRLLRSG